MRDTLRQKIIAVCDKKILAKGETVGLSFYAFFANKNDDPELLMEAPSRCWEMRIQGQLRTVILQPSR